MRAVFEPSELFVSQSSLIMSIGIEGTTPKGPRKIGDGSLIISQGTCNQSLKVKCLAIVTRIFEDLAEIILRLFILL
jgi:hypothetical protein